MNFVTKKVTGPRVALAETLHPIAEILEGQHKARRLLVRSDEKIEHIAAHCGYPSLNAFYMAFKKSSGRTPAEFRKAQRLGK